MSDLDNKESTKQKDGASTKRTQKAEDKQAAKEEKSALKPKPAVRNSRDEKLLVVLDQV